MFYNKSVHLYFYHIRTCVLHNKSVQLHTIVFESISVHMLMVQNGKIFLFYIVCSKVNYFAVFLSLCETLT